MQRPGAGPHKKGICPCPALEPLQDIGQLCPLSGPSDCHASAPSPRQLGSSDCRGGLMAWRHTVMQGRDHPTKEDFAYEKMRRLAFEPRMFLFFSWLCKALILFLQ